MPDGWASSPRVEGVIRTGGMLVVGGRTEPLGRVVLTGADGVAYAAGADAGGRFDVRIPAWTQDVVLDVKAQVGQIAYPAPYRLLVAADPRGPIALLAIGAPTRRLGPAPALDAIDTDGRATLLSGRSAPQSEVSVGMAQGRPVATDAMGRWTTSVSGAAGAPVQVGNATFEPPPLSLDGETRLRRLGGGWVIAWGGAGGARQTTWFPDPPA
ncbi:hypothetical protein [Brevundimonas sp. LM2]|uniref:hypothetical protein n=1 Tax=Brevundimonas sp. LM2 TaxID=1938605 RepID=UPI000987272F|nr:hypothetical protein [Brevundimonas sp. LM2]